MIDPEIVKLTVIFALGVVAATLIYLKPPAPPPTTASQAPQAAVSLIDTSFNTGYALLTDLATFLGLSLPNTLVIPDISPLWTLICAFATAIAKGTRSFTTRTKDIARNLSSFGREPRRMTPHANNILPLYHRDATNNQASAVNEGGELPSQLSFTFAIQQPDRVAVVGGHPQGRCGRCHAKIPTA